MLPISLCRSSETSLEGNNNGLLLKQKWHVFKYMEMCWCRHHWEWQHPGILIWDLICIFQFHSCSDNRLSLPGNLYFHFPISICDHLNLLLYSSWNLYMIQEYKKIGCFCFETLSYGSLCRKSISCKKNSGRFIYYCFLHIILQDMTTLWIICSWFRLCCVK